MQNWNQKFLDERSKRRPAQAIQSPKSHVSLFPDQNPHYVHTEQAAFSLRATAIPSNTIQRGSPKGSPALPPSPSQLKHTQRRPPPREPPPDGLLAEGLLAEGLLKEGLLTEEGAFRLICWFTAPQFFCIDWVAMLI